MKPFSRTHEIILKPKERHQVNVSGAGSVRICPMIEVATVFIGLFSASIFLAHAFDALSGAVER
jgi:hypothetical protein